MIRSVVICFLLIGYAWSASYHSGWLEQEWNQFKEKFEKFYEDDQEDQHKQNVFFHNLRKIAEHNRLYQMGIHSYELGVNHFADLTEEEFLALYTFPFNSTSEYDDAFLDELEEDDDVLDPVPDTLDWSKRGAVTEVKNQGFYCGSCWSFSATGSLEGQWFRKTHQLVSLSEQNLIDCTRNYGNYGCHGGWSYKALEYVKNVGGIYSEAKYPYQGQDNQCRYQYPGHAAKVKKVIKFQGNEDLLKRAVATVGPISVDIVVGGNFHLYTRGIYDNPFCGTVRNHAVLAVGYGTETRGDYWLIKNSWGKHWGVNGYIKMARNKRNQCGIGLACTYPIV